MKPGGGGGIKDISTDFPNHKVKDHNRQDLTWGHVLLKEQSGEMGVNVKIIREEMSDLDGVAEALNGGAPEEGVAEAVFSWTVAERAGEESH